MDVGRVFRGIVGGYGLFLSKLMKWENGKMGRVIVMEVGGRYRIMVRSRGRIVIPRKLREALGIKEGTIIECYAYGDKLIIEKIT